MKRCLECGAGFDAEGWKCPGCGFAPKTVQGWPTFAEDMIDDGPKMFDRDVYSRIVSCERQSFYFRARRRLIIWAIFKHFPKLTNFLDMGTGTGFVLEEIRRRRPDLDLYGSDLALDSLTATKKRLSGPATLFHADARRMPFSNHFDVVGAFDVIEHIDDDVGVLRAVHGIVKPGGGILLSVPQHMAFWSTLDDETGHLRRYVGDELARKTAEAGFDVVFDTSFMATLFVPQYLSRRLWSRRREARFEDEHALPAPFNRFLEGILMTELAMIRAGVRFPFGGMRIVAARKA